MAYTLFMLSFSMHPFFAGYLDVLDCAIAEDRGGEVGASEEQIQGTALQ